MNWKRWKRYKELKAIRQERDYQSGALQYANRPISGSRVSPPTKRG